ncbi:MAG: hypothetical protein KF908_03975 [Nitrosomonas sp.]|nr:hypothetical protein [Nitrosomonas sp.]
MKEQIIYQRYYKNLLLIGTLCACLAAAINLLVDPYDIFGNDRIPYFNLLKPAAIERTRVFKPYQAERLAPKTVIGGNSRPEMGINPHSHCWEAFEQPVYNMGIPGASFYLQSLFALHAVTSGGGNKIFMGIDFSDFLIDSSAKHQNARSQIEFSKNELRLAPVLTGAPDFDHLRQRSADRLTALFSLNALFDSAVTILQQRNKNAATRDENGFNPYHEFNYIVQSEGQWVLFEQKNQELAAMFQRPNLAIKFADNSLSPDFDDLEQFLELAHTKNIDVILFINPYHIDYFKQISRAQLWSDFEEWKREILRIADAYQTVLWDFNTVDQYSTESPPPRNKLGETLRWFVEPAHYSSELGYLMLTSLLGRQCADIDSSDSFGIQLNQTMIDSHLKIIREAVIQ